MGCRRLSSLTDGEIRKIINQYTLRREWHGMQDLTSSTSNIVTDIWATNSQLLHARGGYGGSFENRTRFLRKLSREFIRLFPD